MWGLLSVGKGGCYIPIGVKQPIVVESIPHLRIDVLKSGYRYLYSIYTVYIILLIFWSTAFLIPKSPIYNHPFLFMTHTVEDNSY
jgi:hypothetical protein